MPISDADLDGIVASIYAGSPADSLESETFECKRQIERSRKDALGDVIDAAVCFANTRGGTILVGVADRPGGPDAFVGSDLDPTEIERRARELVDPPLPVSARKINRFGVELIVVDVLPGNDIYADQQGRAMRRSGTSCVRIGPRDFDRIREERQAVDWSAAESTRTIADVSPTAMALARRNLARFADANAPLADLSDAEMLRALGVLGSGPFLLRAGEVLFCGSGVDSVVYQYRATPGSESLAVDRLHGPLVEVFDEAIRIVEARRNVTPVMLPTGEQIELGDFPMPAVREALSNALLHRDYRLPSPVNIEHSPSNFTVVSPGQLVGSVRPDNILTHVSTPRNRKLMTAARMLRLAEETGRGVDRMFREMVRNGKELPVIEDDFDYVRVTFPGAAPRVSLARFVASLDPHVRDDTDALLVLHVLCKKKRVTAAELTSVLQKAAVEIDPILARLVDHAQLLEPTPDTERRKTKRAYRLRPEALQALGSAARYHRTTAERIERKVRAHVTEYGRITNRTVQNLFDYDVYRASAVLSDLVDRGVLVRTSEATRGPSVEYGLSSRVRKGTAAVSETDSPRLFD